MGNISQHEKKYLEAIKFYEKGHDFLKKYFDDPSKELYSPLFNVEQHPAMQQYYNHMTELETQKGNKSAAGVMLKKLQALVKNANKSNSNIVSLFNLRPQYY